MQALVVVEELNCGCETEDDCTGDGEDRPLIVTAEVYCAGDENVLCATDVAPLEVDT